MVVFVSLNVSYSYVSVLGTMPIKDAFEEAFLIINIECAIINPEDKDGPLILTPLIESGQADKARSLSVVDPSLFAGVKSHSGFMNVNKTGKWKMFFWFFPVEDQPLETTPWIIWLQGGPGVSSLLGLFEELGPIRIVNGNDVEKRPIHWGSNYSLLFIDNPVGTGFSFQEDLGNPEIYTEDQVGECLLNFTQQFLDVFPELRKAPLFITGESYAGKYVPALGHYIHNKKADKPINFKGVAIGDGYTDPPSLLHIAEFGLRHGFLDPEQAAKVAKLEAEARKFWDQGNIEMYEKGLWQARNEFWKYTTLNDYNYLDDALGSFDFFNAPFTKYLQRADVMKALHVGDVKYEVYNGGCRLREKDEDLSVKPWLEDLIDHYGVMCYNYLKEYGNFMDVMVRRAGHMVPRDQPEAAKYFLDMFINKFKD